MSLVWQRLQPATRQILVWGCLWGVVVTVAEGVFIQDPDAGLLETLQFWLLRWLLPGWCAVGCVYLFVTRYAEARGGWAPLLLGWLAVSLVWGALQPALFVALSHLVRSSTLARGAIGERIAYNLWPCLFFGGILVAAYALALRGERTRALLQDAAIARSRTNALRGELELAAWQQHVDPALLLNVMGDVEQRYRHQPDQADALLGRLVEFLRCAMPGLKDRASTLAAELQLAQAYVGLQAARALGVDNGSNTAAGWTLITPTDLPQLAFPGQLMLPLLALATAQATPQLRVRRLAAGVRIEVDGLGQPVPEAFAQQARTRLQSLLGDSFTLSLGSAQPPQLVMTLGRIHSPGDNHEPRP